MIVQTLLLPCHSTLNHHFDRFGAADLTDTVPARVVEYCLGMSWQSTQVDVICYSLQTSLKHLSTKYARNPSHKPMSYLFVTDEVNCCDCALHSHNVYILMCVVWIAVGFINDPEYTGAQGSRNLSGLASDIAYVCDRLCG